jgi:hypothetical protein
VHRAGALQCVVASAVLRLHAGKEPPPPRELNPEPLVEVARVLLKSLAKQREARYQTGPLGDNESELSGDSGGF